MQERPQKFLVYGDVSGSTSAEDIKQMLDFARTIDADIATFDTELRMLPQHPSIGFDVINAFVHGGTDIRKSIRMLCYQLLETYVDYRCIFILGDLYMEPFLAEDIKNFKHNFYVLAMNATREAEEAQALAYEKRLDGNGLEHRTKVLSFKEYLQGMKEAKERAQAMGI